MFKKSLFLVLFISAGILCLPFVLSYLIDHGYTNAESEVVTIDTGVTINIPASNRQVHKYLLDHPEDAQSIEDAYQYMHGTGNNGSEWFPKSMLKDVGFMFIVKGFKTREVIYDTIVKTSKELGIEPELVLASVMGEQVRIAAKGARGNLKGVIVNNTPRFLVSYNVSLGVGGIKTSTARDIARDAKEYGYGDIFGSYSESGLVTMLTTSNYRQGIYPTYLVKNILVRREKAGVDISKAPGIVGTLYNMGNNEKKQPHAMPQIGGAVIKVGGKNYTYGGLSMVMYWYLKIYQG